MGYGRRVRFIARSSGLSRLEFATEFLTRTARRRAGAEDGTARRERDPRAPEAEAPQAGPRGRPGL